MSVEIDYCVPEAQRLADLWSVAEDLRQAIRYCDLHIEIDPTESVISAEEMLRREHIRQALCRAAIIAYGRSFTNGVRPGLDQDFVRRLLPKSQGLHATIRALRDKWIAHAVNHFDDIRVRVTATESDDGSLTIQGVSIAAQAVGGFVQAWMLDFRALCTEALVLVESDFRSESDRLTVHVRARPVKEILSRDRVDGVSMHRDTLEPLRPRARYK
jgi:hypothetical protein